MLLQEVQAFINVHRDFLHGVNSKKTTQMMMIRKFRRLMTMTKMDLLTTQKDRGKAQPPTQVAPEGSL